MFAVASAPDGSGSINIDESVFAFIPLGNLENFIEAGIGTRSSPCIALFALSMGVLHTGVRCRLFASRFSRTS